MRILQRATVAPSAYRRRVKSIHAVAVLILAATLATGCTSAKTPAAAPVTSPAASPSVAPPSPSPSPSDTYPADIPDGSYIVGETIEAGTYETTVPTKWVYGGRDLAHLCYWEREKNLNGDLSGVLVNDNIAAGKTGTVTIKATDAGFRTDGCGTWRRIT